MCGRHDALETAWGSKLVDFAQAVNAASAATAATIEKRTEFRSFRDLVT
ncbi:MAG TPA: hypothetical protein VIW73_14365 [Candidatus Cybelea sp.]